MPVLVVALIVVLILFGAGFALHLLWWVAIVALVLWLLGFVVRGAESAGSRRRWYNW